MNISSLSVRTYLDILEGKTPYGVSDAILQEVRERFPGGAREYGCYRSSWGSFCAIVCQLRVLSYRNVEWALNLQPFFRDYGMHGDKRAEHYVFGVQRVFERTTPAHHNLLPDYDRVLNGRTSDDSIETVIKHLYRFVTKNKRGAFARAASCAFGVYL